MIFSVALSPSKPLEFIKGVTDSEEKKLRAPDLEEDRLMDEDIMFINSLMA